MAIGSNTNALKFDEVVSSLLSKDMRLKNMEGKITYTLFARGHSHEINRSKFSSGRSKSKGRSKSIGKFVKVESCASFHMTPHMEWFYEYETYDGGNVL